VYKQDARNQIHAVKEEHMVWHYRLGHPSSDIMSIFFKHLSNSIYQDSLYDVCFRAKQTRNSLPLSHNKAQDLFEIVYCDIWGPYWVSTSCGTRYFLTLVEILVEVYGFI